MGAVGWDELSQGTFAGFKGTSWIPLASDTVLTLEEWPPVLDPSRITRDAGRGVMDLSGINLPSIEVFVGFRSGVGARFVALLLGSL